MASRSATGPATDEALIWNALTRVGSHPHRHHAGSELLKTVACGCLCACSTRRGARAEGGKARPHCHCDRGGVANGPAKLLARRRRPSSQLHPTLIRTPRSTSFPSGHSAAAFAFVTGACADLPILAPVLVPLAGTVAYSRVHTGVHYPSDVAVGVGIGIGSGLLVAHWPWACSRARAPRARRSQHPATTDPAFTNPMTSKTLPCNFRASLTLGQQPMARAGRRRRSRT